MQETRESMTTRLNAMLGFHFGSADTRRMVRTLLGCVLSYGVAKLASLPELYWALITTLVVVTQPSLTQTLSTARDQITGACIGAVVGVIGILAIQRGVEPMLVFAVALIPLAALTSLKPGLRLACITLVIVVLIPGVGHSPFDRPIDRVLEILIGAAAAFIVTVILPNRAVRNAHDCGAKLLDALGHLSALYFSDTHDEPEAQRWQKIAAESKEALDDALVEAGHEHVVVPIHHGSADAIDKITPILSRLHRDTLFLGEAVAGSKGLSKGDKGSAKQRFGEAFSALTALLKSKRVDVQSADAARTTIDALNMLLFPEAIGTQQNAIMCFVARHMVQDMTELTDSISPRPKSADA
jgi:Fusaric acid resistance protein family